jgi:hypothetical protein
LSYDTPLQRLNRERALERHRVRNKQGIKTAQKLATEAAKVYAAQQAGELPLSEESVKKFLQLTPAELNVLGMIAGGRPPRNSTPILAAIKLKLEYTMKRPQTDEQRGAAPITVIIKSLAPVPADTTVEVIEPAPSAEEQT